MRTSKKETLKFGETKNAIAWLELMNDAVQIDSEQEANSFFKDVEKLAGRLGFILENGKKFSASSAIQDYKIVNKKVEDWIDELERDYGEDDIDIPSIGLVYRNYGDRLVLGIHDGLGGFDEMYAWNFVNT